MRSRHDWRLEQLEERAVPALFGIPWPDPQHLTLSFVPDGTQVGNQTSDLSAKLGGSSAASSPGALAAWQKDVLEAFAIWSQYANFNVGVVSDSGLPLGTNGAIQGDPRFGDIRIAGYSMAADTMAIATPFDVRAGTWAGDIEFNTDLLNSQDVSMLQVGLHEAGHALGLADSTNPQSPMFEDYLNRSPVIQPEDIAALQALYGARPQEESNASNDTIATASKLDQDPTAGSHLLVADGDLGNSLDQDFYRLNLSGPRGSVTVRLQTAGLSLLRGQLSIVDDTGTVLASISATDPGTDLTLSLDPTKGTKSLYIEVDRAADDPFAIGRYHLEVDAGGHGQGAAPDHSSGPSGNNSQSPVISLQASQFRDDGRFAYLYQGQLTDAQPSANFQFLAADPSSGANVMTVMVWSKDAAQGLPVSMLTDDLGNPVPVEVLVSEPGVYVLQIANATQDAPYRLNVRTASGGALGAYSLAITFSDRTTPLDTLLSNAVLTGPEATVAGTLEIDQSQLFHLVATAAPNQAGADETMVLEIRNQAQTVVATLLLGPGGAISATPFLAQGDYTFTLRDQDPLENWAPLTFTLQGAGLSDPIGPEPDRNQTIPQSSPGDAPAPATYRWEAGLTGILLPPPPGGGNPGPTSSTPTSDPSTTTGTTGTPGPATGTTATTPSATGATGVTTGTTTGTTGTATGTTPATTAGATGTTAATVGATGPAGTTTGTTGGTTTAGPPSGGSSGGSPSGPSSDGTRPVGTTATAASVPSSEKATASPIAAANQLSQMLSASGQVANAGNLPGLSGSAAGASAGTGASAEGVGPAGSFAGGLLARGGNPEALPSGMDTAIRDRGPNSDPGSGLVHPTTREPSPLARSRLSEGWPWAVDLPGSPGHPAGQTMTPPEGTILVVANDGLAAPERPRTLAGSIQALSLAILVSLLGILRLFPSREQSSHTQPGR